MRKICTYTGAFCTCDSTPQIQVLSDHKEAIFDVIQHITNDEASNRFSPRTQKYSSQYGLTQNSSDH